MPILTSLTKKEFQKILDKYDLGEYKSHEHISFALSNTIYKVETSKNKVIIKLFEHEDRKVINLQIKIMEKLEKKKLSPKLFKTKEGKYTYKLKKPLIVQKFFEGKHLKKFTNRESEDFGTFLAKLQKILKTLGKKERWKIGYQFKKNNSKYNSIKINLSEEFKFVSKSLKEVNQKNFKIGTIHGDLSSSNILKNKQGKIMLCDWDDARKDYLIYDLAILIGNFMVSEGKVYNHQISELIKSYQSLIKISENDKKAIYYFALHSLLWGLEYGAKQFKKHKEKGIKKWMIKQERKYITIKKFGLQKFLFILK